MIAKTGAGRFSSVGGRAFRVEDEAAGAAPGSEEEEAQQEFISSHRGKNAGCVCDARGGR